MAIKTERKSKKEIPADFVPSPHDTEVAFRKKNAQTVVGNRIDSFGNLTDTMKNGLNLLIDDLGGNCRPS